MKKVLMPLMVLAIIFGLMNKANALMFTETVESDNSSLSYRLGTRTSISLDINGNPYIAYKRHYTNTGTEMLRYAYFDGMNWQTKTVTSMTKLYGFSLVIDGNNHLHFCYVDVRIQDNKSILYYSYYDGDKWSIKKVREVEHHYYVPGIVIGDRSMTVRDTGGGLGYRPEITYSVNEYIPYLLNPHIEHAYPSNVGGGGEWVKHTVDGPSFDILFVGGVDVNAGEAPQIVQENDGTAHILYLYYKGYFAGITEHSIKQAYELHAGHYEKVWLARCNSIDCLRNIAFSIDANNDSHIGYVSDYGLTYALYTDGCDCGEGYCEEEDVACYQSNIVNTSSGIKGTSIAVDDANDAHISLCKGNLIGVRGWSTEYSQNFNGTCSSTSIAVDQNGNDHVSHSYFDKLSYTIRCLDEDGDGVCDNTDNCPDDPNTLQNDIDGDGFGDACDNCPGRASSNNNDSDGDGIGDVCDNCKFIFNPDQLDSDEDSLGNPTPDGVGDVCDNCINVPNGPKLGSCIPENYVGVSLKRPLTCKLDTLEPCQESCFETAQELLLDCRKFQVPGVLEACINNVESKFYDCIDQCDCSVDTYCSAAQEDVNYNRWGDACEPFSPVSYGLIIERSDNISLPDVAFRSYEDLLCINTWCPPSIISLYWGGSTMSLTIEPPLPKLPILGPVTSDSSPIKIQVPYPEPGLYKTEVYAVADIPIGAYPFTLKIEIDRDEDGIADNADECPSDPFNDSDQDGVCGNIDNCPSEYNEEQFDFDQDGVGDKCDNCRFIANADQKDDNYNKIGNACEKLSITVDIKPDDCVNYLNLKSKGLLPVAILGTENFNVMQIDLETIKLAGVPPIRKKITDVTGPDVCIEVKDGYADLMLKFITQDVISALGQVEAGQMISLSLTGNLKTEFLEQKFEGHQVVEITE